MFYGTVCYIGNICKSSWNSAQYKAHIPSKNGFALGARRKWNQHKKYEMYMPNAKTQRQGPNATYIPLEMGFAFATQRKEINMLVFFALGDAKILSFALDDAKVPDARYFAFWWNIGLKVYSLGRIRHVGFKCVCMTYALNVMD